MDRSAGTLIGRPLAVAGLGLAVCFGTAALTAHFGSQHLLARKAQQVVGQWFQALAQGKTQVAHQWTFAPTYRAKSTDLEQLESYYENDEKRRDELAHFVGQPLIATLLRLGAGSCRTGVNHDQSN